MRTRSPETHWRHPSLGFLLLALWAVGAAGQEVIEPPIDAAAQAGDWSVLDRRPADGEQCLVCRQAIHHGEIVEMRYRGRRFHVSADMVETFESDPERYFNRLRARAALFDEDSVVRQPMSNRWLGLGLYTLLGLVSAAGCGYLAVAKALRPMPWFLAGLFFNVVALGAILMAPKGDLSKLPEGVPKGLRKVPLTLSPLVCSECGETNHPSAASCGQCGTALTPSAEPETARV